MEILRKKIPYFHPELFTEHHPMSTPFNLSGTTFDNEQSFCQNFACVYSREVAPAQWKKPMEEVESVCPKTSLSQGGGEGDSRSPRATALLQGLGWQSSFKF